MDILEALEAASIEVHDGANENEIWICCPFCLEEGETSVDERFRLGINIVSGKASCFNCGKKAGGGDWIFKELERVLDAGEIEANQEARTNKKSIVTDHELPDGFQTFIDGDKDSWYKKAYHYTRRRGITDRQIEEKGIGFTLVGRYHHRIIFPVYIKHKLIGFGSRDFIGDQEPKHKNSVGDKALYNYPRHTEKTAVLSESAITALAIERASNKLCMDSLGIFGHSLTGGQIKLLEPYKRIILWLDPDSAGIKGSIQITKKLPKDKVIKIVLPRDFVHSGANDADPDELEREVITRRLLKAENFTEGLQSKLKSWIAFEE